MSTLSTAVVIAGIALLLVVGGVLWTFFDGRRKTPAATKFIAGEENAGI